MIQYYKCPEYGSPYYTIYPQVDTSLSTRIIGQNVWSDWVYYIAFLQMICCCWCCYVTSVVSDSVRPHRQQPTRLPRSWDSPGKNTGVGCHFLLQCMKVSESEVAQLCPTLHDPMDCGLPGSSAHGIFRARVLEWVSIDFSPNGIAESKFITLYSLFLIYVSRTYIVL